MKVYLSNGQILDITTQEYKELFSLKNKDQAEIEEIISRKKYKHHRKLRSSRKGQSNWSSFLAKLRRKRREIHESNPEFTKQCEICNKSYIARIKRQRFCSVACKKENVRRKYYSTKLV